MASDKEVKAETAKNQPREYEVTRSFPFNGEYPQKGEKIMLTPSQAEYFISTGKLKGAK